MIHFKVTQKDIPPSRFEEEIYFFKGKKLNSEDNPMTAL